MPRGAQGRVGQPGCTVSPWVFRWHFSCTLRGRGRTADSYVSPIPGPGAYGDHGKTCRCGKALLGSGDSDIDTPLVCLNDITADRGDAVHDEERIVLPAELPISSAGFLIPADVSLCTRVTTCAPASSCALSASRLTGVPQSDFISWALTVTLADLQEPLAKFAVGDTGNMLVLSHS